MVVLLYSVLLSSCQIDRPLMPEHKDCRRGRNVPSLQWSDSGIEELFQFPIKALSALARLRLLKVLFSTPRSLNPRRLEIILDLELVLFDPDEWVCWPFFPGKKCFCRSGNAVCVEREILA